MITYLSISDIADRTGYNINTVKGYARRGQLPEPDAQIGLEGRVWNGWLPETIDQWAPSTRATAEA
ncbi:XRE family transcriptional regulator [Rhodococcus sp. MEB041]|uniref:XRE family transcriptional regulator n=1 Tax=Rhodococcus sp. MEB041 TaxID=3040323 RepID=UPI00254DB303|nr:XRE family transcriptional regulator [Rhodococcus sp. MEB041]